MNKKQMSLTNRETNELIDVLEEFLEFSLNKTDPSYNHFYNKAIVRLSKFIDYESRSYINEYVEEVNQAEATLKQQGWVYDQNESGHFKHVGNETE